MKCGWAVRNKSIIAYQRPPNANQQSTMGVLDYHTEDLLRREDFILSTRFARMDPVECFFVFRHERRRGMADRWQCESTCFLEKLRSRSMLEYTSASVHSMSTSSALPSDLLGISSAWQSSKPNATQLMLVVFMSWFSSRYDKR